MIRASSPSDNAGVPRQPDANSPEVPPEGFPARPQPAVGGAARAVRYNAVQRERGRMSRTWAVGKASDSVTNSLYRSNVLCKHIGQRSTNDCNYCNPFHVLAKSKSAK